MFSYSFLISSTTSILSNNEENNINKSINLPKANLIEMMNKEDKDKEDKNENDDTNNKNILNKIINQDKNDNINENSEAQLIKCKIC